MGNKNKVYKIWDNIEEQFVDKGLGYSASGKGKTWTTRGAAACAIGQNKSYIRRYPNRYELVEYEAIETKRFLVSSTIDTKNGKRQITYEEMNIINNENIEENLEDI